jgi:hypothetical protein
MTPMDIEIWDGNAWSHKHVVGHVFSGNTLLTDEGKVYSFSQWRIPGTRPQSYCQTKQTVVVKERRRGKLVTVRKARIKNARQAGPFKKNELWMAEKMVKENPKWKIVKRGAAWWVV